ncbi:MAG: HD domain-containing protein [Chitinivibrionales bacterium]|nr:HD domain-containing protein [Chitinivibrionales bacterium]
MHFLKPRRTRQLESALSASQIQSRMYAQDLAKVYRVAKSKNKEAADKHAQLVHYAADLRQSISDMKKVYLKLQESYYDTIHKLVLAAEYKDKETGRHITRMCSYCVVLAEKLGLTKKEVQNIFYAAPMHDVGKIGIPDTIIMKPMRLTTEEMEIMKRHTIIGSNILANSKAEILVLAQKIALWHHEKWDGSGYPHGLTHQSIPLMCRIVALADAFDALTSKRPYKNSWPIDVACDIIKKESGKSFDPDITAVFFRHLDDLLKIKADVESVESDGNAIVPDLFNPPEILLKPKRKN